MKGTSLTLLPAAGSLLTTLVMSKSFLRRSAFRTSVFAAASAVLANAASVYVVNSSQQFATVDLSTGAFQQISSNAPAGGPEGYDGMAAMPNGSVLTLQFNGDVYSIDPTGGKPTLIGSSGLADCTIPGVSPCGPMSAFSLAGVGGNVYATDFRNDLYSINPVSAKATLIGPTGIPPSPFDLGSANPDGTLNFADEALWSSGGTLYATFDAFTFNLSSFAVVSVTVAPELYQIDPLTGRSRLIGPTDLGIGAATSVNGTSYGFNNLQFQVVSLDLTSGKTSFVADFDPAAGEILGASPVPEPNPVALTGFGMIGLALLRRRSVGHRNRDSAG